MAPPVLVTLLLVVVLTQHQTSLPAQLAGFLATGCLARPGLELLALLCLQLSATGPPLSLLSSLQQW